MGRVIDNFIKLFKTNELEASPTLQLAAWALLLGWFVQFSFWSRFADFTINAVKSGSHTCWPFLQNCGDFYFLTQEPIGNSHILVYTFLFALLFIAGYALIRRHFVLLISLFLLFFVWEIFVMLMSMRLVLEFWYIHAFYAALFIFSLNKLFFLRIGVVLLYFVSGITKLTDSWLKGSYFKALQDGLYFIPDSLIALTTNAVVVLQLVFVWLLFIEKREIRLTALGALFLFHLYSVLYIGYLFTAVVLPILLIIFISQEDYPLFKSRIKVGIAGAGILILFIVMNAVSYFITGDARFTGEGDQLGLNLFTANHQCVSYAEVYSLDGRKEQMVFQSTFSSQRCDPYVNYFFLKQVCSRVDIDHIEWTHDVSVNGGSLKRIIDVENVCGLTYRPFTHNEWIGIPRVDEVESVGVVLPNTYRVTGSPGEFHARDAILE